MSFLPGPGAARRAGALPVVLAVALAALPAAAQDPPPAERAVPGAPAGPTVEQRIADLQARIAAQPREARLYNELGLLHAEREDWPQARDAFIRAVQAAPQTADYHHNLGLVFLRLQEYELAASEFATYQNFGGAAATDGWRLVGRARELAGDAAGALAAYDEGLTALGREATPEVMRLAAAKARLLQEREDAKDLRSLLEIYQPLGRQLRDAAAATDPPATAGVAEAEALENGLVALRLDEARDLLDAGRAADAVALLEEVDALAPDRDDVLPRLVEAYLAAGEAATARSAVDLARQQRPDGAGTWVATGQLAEHEGDLAAAADAYARAREIDPAWPGLGVVLGNLYVSLGRAAEGRALLAPAIDDPAAPPELVYNYAVTLVQEKRYGEALPLLQRVVRARPDNGPGWAALGHALRGLDRCAEAVVPYQRALELAPDARLAFNLGVCAAQAGQPDVALAAYDQAIALDPAFGEAHYARGLALTGAGRLEEALAAFDAALELEPDSYRILLNQGATLYRLKRYAEAVSKYNLALEQRETPEAFDNLGLAYQGLGDRERAQAMFREAKKLRGGQ